MNGIIFRSYLTLILKISIASAKIGGDRGSPCLAPLDIGNGVERLLAWDELAKKSERQIFIHLIIFSPKLKKLKHCNVNALHNTHAGENHFKFASALLKY